MLQGQLRAAVSQLSSDKLSPPCSTDGLFSQGSTALCLGDILYFGDNQWSEQMPLALRSWETSPVTDERERLKSSI